MKRVFTNFMLFEEGRDHNPDREIVLGVLVLPAGERLDGLAVTKSPYMGREEVFDVYDFRIADVDGCRVIGFFGKEIGSFYTLPEAVMYAQKRLAS